MNGIHREVNRRRGSLTIDVPTARCQTIGYRVDIEFRRRCAKRQQRGIGRGTQHQARVGINGCCDRECGVAGTARECFVAVVTQVMQHRPCCSNRPARLCAERPGRAIHAAEPVVGNKTLMRAQLSVAIHNHRGTLGGVTKFVQIHAH